MGYLERCSFSQHRCPTCQGVARPEPGLRGPRAGLSPHRAVPAPGCPAGGDRGCCSAAAAAEGTEALFSPVNKGTIVPPPGHCSPPTRGQRAPSRAGPGGQRLRRARGSGVSPDNLLLSQARPPAAAPTKLPLVSCSPWNRGSRGGSGGSRSRAVRAPAAPRVSRDPRDGAMGRRGRSRGLVASPPPQTQRPRVSNAAGASALQGIGTFAGRSGGSDPDASPSASPDASPHPAGPAYHGEGSGSGAAAGAERRCAEAALGRARSRLLS